MKTRSGKVLLPVAPPRPQSRAQAQPQPLRAQPTLSQLEVTPSATGQGTHTRWVRGDSSSPGASPASDNVASNEISSAPVTTTATGQVPAMSTPGQPTSFDLSAYITPEPWVPTSPPRPSPFSPLSRGGPHARPTRHTSQYSTDVSPYPSSISRLGAGEEDDTPSARRGDGDGPRLNALGSAAHERLQASLANGARADRPRGRPLVGPTGTFVQTPLANVSVPNGVKPKPAEEFDGLKTCSPLPQLVCGSPLGSPYSSQEENFNFTLRDQVKGSARSKSPTRRRCVK
ncbi:hypothetical protein FA13DRAFT_160172 [Coprinellus micaceus]|uniref:Uncharacterized protein n=1 Tax=Coprinellus micaceus TaxID=71717 RepID=A0A4Y7TJ20_COPMI|nr:hypothetical protein FA13DRAFT_160172 [Coprinellus micaceus]